MERLAVDVWAVDLVVADEVVARCAARLDRRELDAAAVRRSVARRRYTVAHAALREILALRLGREAHEIAYRFRCAVCGGPHGKPVVVDADGIDFSLGHSGDAAVVAVSGDGRVGVDVEWIRPRRHLARLAERVMGDAEHGAWLGLPEAARPAAFLAAWTRREAYLKALGVGLTRPLAGAEPSAGWTATTWDGRPPGYVTTVVVEGSARLPATPARWPDPRAASVLA